MQSHETGMRPRERLAAHGIVMLLVACFAGGVAAQTMWKYVDKDGKVTYSDKAPKPGEKAEAVANDPAANVIELPRSAQPNSSRVQEVNAKVASREKLRDALRKSLDDARAELDAATKNLEDGQTPTQDERQIVVGRNKAGKPTGANTTNPKPEYYQRVAGLEDAVKKAQAKVTAAEEELRRNAPN